MLQHVPATCPLVWAHLYSLLQGNAFPRAVLCPMFVGAHHMENLHHNMTNMKVLICHSKLNRDTKTHALFLNVHILKWVHLFPLNWMVTTTNFALGNWEWELRFLYWGYYWMLKKNSGAFAVFLSYLENWVCKLKLENNCHRGFEFTYSMSCLSLICLFISVLDCWSPLDCIRVSLWILQKHPTKLYEDCF